ncbi:hypothetical protein XCM_11830 [Xanthomonas citri pv. mangiferaeindicae]|nr:hypothetical protein Xcnt_17875 [Xanthomonas campestris pv. centellae]UDI81682.1 hypothetical protein XCM_11830 [Xanthomonas citri pv. mangiferaeindicae]
MTRCRRSKALIAIALAIVVLNLSGCATGYYGLYCSGTLPEYRAGDGVIQTDVQVYVGQSGISVVPAVRYLESSRRRHP